MEVKYSIANGRIETPSLEAHVVDHCNLRCWGCCSLSPYLPPWYVDPEDLRRELDAARDVLAPGIFKLVGGEPLLHPGIIDCLEVARGSGIAPVISVTTNGLLIRRMPEAFWKLADALTVSLYPRPALPAGILDHIQRKCRAHGVSLNLKKQDAFVDMTRDVPEKRHAINRSIFNTCWLRRRCHILRDGVFYTCTRPPHFQTLFGGRRDFISDGVRLHGGKGLLRKLREYLVREAPLRACALCRGGDAPARPARQISTGEVRAAVEAVP